MVRKEDFQSFITKDEAKEYLNEEHSNDRPLLMHSISQINEALAPLVERELDDFFVERDRERGKGKLPDQEMEM